MCGASPSPSPLLPPVLHLGQPAISPSPSTGPTQSLTVCPDRWQFPHLYSGCGRNSRVSIVMLDLGRSLACSSLTNGIWSVLSPLYFFADRYEAEICELHIPRCHPTLHLYGSRPRRWHGELRCSTIRQRAIWNHFRDSDFEEIAGVRCDQIVKRLFRHGHWRQTIAMECYAALEYTWQELKLPPLLVVAEFQGFRRIHCCLTYIVAFALRSHLWRSTYTRAYWISTGSHFNHKDIPAVVPCDFEMTRKWFRARREQRARATRGQRTIYEIRTLLHNDLATNLQVHYSKQTFNSGLVKTDLHSRSGSVFNGMVQSNPPIALLHVFNAVIPLAEPGDHIADFGASELFYSPGY